MMDTSSIASFRSTFASRVGELAWCNHDAEDLKQVHDDSATYLRVAPS